ncbi:hypothetical protein ACTFIW_003376 [Dictyostelium discoideum]
MNAATAVIFMNLFTIHCTQNGVNPTLKTILDNGAASNEFLQLLQPTHNESVKNNDKIEGETLKKLIHRRKIFKFRTDTIHEIVKGRKLNTQTDITDCREAITELVLNNADKFSRKRPSDSAPNTGEKFPMKNNHSVPNQNSHSRNSHDAQAEKIRAETLPKLGNGSKVDLKKVRSSFIVYRESKGYCLNCGGESKSKIININYKILQYHHLEDFDFPVNKDSLYTLNSFYNQNIVTQLHQQSQQNDVHKNINKLKEYVKHLYGIKLVPDTTVPIPKAVESEMKYKPQKIDS